MIPTAIMPAMTSGVFTNLLKDQMTWPIPEFAANDFGDDQIRPAPAKRDAQIVNHVRQCRRNDYVPQNLAVRGAKGLPGLDIFRWHPFGVIRDQKKQLKKRSHP